ncbi:MAG TPA: sigma factor [Gallionella sp.]|nr:sigma factor [Gallionella sp.]
MTAFAYLERGALYETISIAGRDRFRHDSQALPLDGAQDPALMQRIKQGDFDARQKLITGNLRHVLHNNRRYARNGAGLFDLLKAGNRGLAHALENFDPESDGPFSEYAALCIRQHIETTLNPVPRPAEHKNIPPCMGYPSGIRHNVVGRAAG